MRNGKRLPQSLHRYRNRQNETQNPGLISDPICYWFTQTSYSLMFASSALTHENSKTMKYHIQQSVRKRITGSIRSFRLMLGFSSMLIIALPLFYGCNDDDNPDSPDNPLPGTGEVTLTVNWPDKAADIGIPQSYEALFIPTIGNEQKFTNLSGTSNVLSVNSGKGELIVYTLPSGLEVNGKTAKINTENNLIPASPDLFFCWSGQLEITAGASVQKTADMTQQMRELRMSIGIEPQNIAPNITKISATLTGVASEINMTDGTLSSEGIVSFNFTTGESTAIADTRLLGVVNGSNPTLSVSFEISGEKTKSVSREIGLLFKDFNTNKTIPVRITSNIRLNGSESPEMATEWRNADETATRYNDKDVVRLQGATAFGTEKDGANIVIMGDGYLQEDMVKGSGKYESDMREAMDHFFSVYPYNKYREYFNVYMVVAVSNEEGMSVKSPASIKDTRFKTVWDGPGVSTQISGDYDTMVEYCSYANELKNIPEGDLTIIVPINSNAYAGTCNMRGDGLSISMCPTLPDYRSVVIHEAGGHGFAKLMDEYVYYKDVTLPADEVEKIKAAKKLGFAANLDLTGDISKTTWSGFNTPKYTTDSPEANRVSTFEGGFMYGLGIWRPEYNSCMSNNIPYYNAPSRWAAVKRISDICGLGITFEEYTATEVIPEYPAAKERALRGVPFVPYGEPVFMFK